MTATHAYGHPVIADLDGVLVLEVPGQLTRQQAEMVKNHIRSTIGRESLILAGGVHLAGIIASPDAGTPIYDELVDELEHARLFNDYAAHAGRNA